MEPLNRRGFLRMAGLAGAAWLTPVGHLLARAAEAPGKPRDHAQSIIMLWLQGGPSQLETFDPHPGTRIAAGHRGHRHGRQGRAAGARLRAHGRGDGLDQPDPLDGEQGRRPRARHLRDEDRLPARPDGGPSVDRGDLLPRIAGGRRRHPAARQHPAQPVGRPAAAISATSTTPSAPTTRPTRCPIRRRCAAQRDEERLRDLDVVEGAFAAGRQKRVEATLHRESVAGALKMMSSEQLKAFDVSQESAGLAAGLRRHAVRPRLPGGAAADGGGRALRRGDAGRLGHAREQPRHGARSAEVLDPAFSTLIRDLRKRGLLERTVVLCAGEFGRTPNDQPGRAAATTGPPASAWRWRAAASAAAR